MHEQPPWLVRVLNSRGGTAGTGVAIDGEHVVTCAHLAEARPGGQTALLLGEGREVELEFPFLGRTATAKVLDDGWFPEKADGSGDFAVLRLTNPPPSLSPAPLQRIPSSPGTAIEARGFPDDQAAARTAKGRLSNPPRPEWVQIDPDGDSGWSIEKGFSGGPIWDVERKAVIGLTVAKDAHRTGHMLPLRYLCELWPPLTERLTTIPPAAEKDLSHWWPRARGLSGAHQQGWLFRGRRKALTEIVDWLDHGRRHTVLVVTGTPGVGKSATLGRIVTTSHGPWAAMLPADDTAVRAKPDSVDCALHAQGKTALEVATEVMTKAGGGAVERLEDFEREIAYALADAEQFNVVLDALDEASDAGEARLIASKVLRPLSEILGTRVVVGSRRLDGEGDLLAHFGDGLHRLNLDSSEYFEFEDLAAYAEAALRQASSEQPHDPYGNPGAAGQVASRIAELSEGNFLVAGLVARSRGRYDAEPVAPEALVFSSDVNVVFWKYLERLEPFNGIPAEDLLTALAFADAPGFTAELWSTAVEALYDERISPKSLTRFARLGAANFLIDSGAGQDRSFRIFHQALVDACLPSPDQEEDRIESEAALTDAFLELGKARGWEQAPRYLWRSLTGHADRGGKGEALLQDLDFLVVTEPDRMLPLLTSASTEESMLRASIYRASSGHLHNAPIRERRALLAYNASRYGAAEVAAGLYGSQGGKSLGWRPTWATGSGIDSRLHLTIPATIGAQGALACTVLGDAPVMAAGYTHVVKTWDLATGRLLTEIPATKGVRVTAVACSKLDDRAVLVTGHDDGTLVISDLVTGRPVREIPIASEAAVKALTCIEVDGHPVVVSGDEFGVVRIADLRTGRQRGGDLIGHTSEISDVACTLIGLRPVALTGSADGTVRVWDLVAEREDHVIQSSNRSSPSSIKAVDCALLNDRSVAVIGEIGGPMRIWDLEVQEQYGETFGNERDLLQSLSCTELDGSPVAVTGALDGQVRVWDLVSRAQRGDTFLASQRGVTTMSCTVVNGRSVAIAGGYSDVHVWDLSNHERHGASTPGHTDNVNSVASITVDGTIIVVSTSQNRDLVMWNGDTGRRIGTLSIDHSASIRAIACTYLAGVPIVAAAGHGDVLRLWRLDTREQLRPFLIDREWRSSIGCAVVEDRSAVLTCTEDGNLRLWDLETGTLIREIDAADDRGFRSVDTLTVDGEDYAAFIGFGGGLRALNLRTGLHRSDFTIDDLDSYDGLSCTVLGDKCLAAVIRDYEVEIWDILTKSKIAVIPFPEEVEDVAFTEDGRLVVASGRDISVFKYIPNRRKHAA